MNFRSRLLILALPVLFSCTKDNSSLDGISQQHTSDSLTRIQSDFLDQVPGWLDEYKVPAAGIGLIEDGAVKHLQVFGELEAGSPAPENTIFNVASVTKTIGTILTLKLVEAGLWDLDESLSKYWVDPDVADDPVHKQLTTRHVLTHTTGFVNWREDHPSKKLTFDHEPGEEFGYSGEGFQYLQNALESKFNMPVEDLTDSLIFKPLGMNDTQHSWDKHTDESRFAYWHDSNGSKYDISNKTYWACLDDDLITTIQDYCKFGINVMNGADLSPELFNAMIQPQANVKDHRAVGLGWFLVNGIPDGEYVIHHGGGDVGVIAVGLFLPVSKRGLVIFTNGDNGIPVIENVIKAAFENGDDIWANLY